MFLFGSDTNQELARRSKSRNMFAAYDKDEKDGDCSCPLLNIKFLNVSN